MEWFDPLAGGRLGEAVAVLAVGDADAVGAMWTAVATSAAQSITNAGAGLDTVQGPFADSIPIQAGDRIALQPTDDVNAPTEPGVPNQDGIRYFVAPFSNGGTASIDPASANVDNAQVVPIQATVQFTPGPPLRTLAVTLAGSGSGTVSGDASPAISCPGACSRQYPDGTTVTLTEHPAAGSKSGGWSGGGCPGTASTCSVALGADATVTATFTKLGPVPRVTHPPDVVLPMVARTPVVGQTVLCKNDTWISSGQTFFTYTWFETTIDRGSHGAIVHQTTQVASGPSRSFVVPDFPPGASLYCTATATDANGSSAPAAATAVTILATTPVLARGNPTLSIFASPTITPSVDIHLRKISVCTPGTWLHHPTNYRHDWFALPSQGAALSAGTTVGTGPTLIITAREEVQWLVCRVTATNQAPGPGVALSNRYFVSEPDFGIRVNAIEITQGVQTFELPTRSATDPTADHVSYQGFVLPWKGQPNTCNSTPPGL